MTVTYHRTIDKPTSGRQERQRTLSRREPFNLARLWLLPLRVRIASPLPGGLMAILRTLDRWSAERAVDRPWTPEASRRLDRMLSAKDRER